MALIDITPERSLITFPGVQSHQGASGVELFLDASCQQPLPVRWTLFGVGTRQSIEYTQGAYRALRLTCSAGIFIDTYQTVLTAGRTYRLRGEFRTSGGTVECEAYLGSVDVSPSLAAGLTDWTAFDVVGVADAAQAYIGGVSMGVGDWIEFRNMSVQRVLQITPAQGIASVRRLGAELVVDGDMEAVGTAAWSSLQATLSKETSTPAEGGQYLHILATAGAGLRYPEAFQTILTVGATYIVSGFLAGDGTQVPYVYNGATLLFTGTSSVSWQYFEVTFVATATTLEFLFAINNPTGTEYIDVDFVSCKHVEVSGAVPMMGTDGLTAAQFPSIITPRGFSFDGGDQIATPSCNAYSFTNGVSDLPFTLAAYVKIDDTLASHTFISKAQTVNGEYALYVQSNGRITFLQFDATTGAYIGRYSTAVIANVGIYCCVSVTSDGSGIAGIRLYKDGVRVDTTNSSGGGVYTRMRRTADALRVGAGTTGVSSAMRGNIIAPMVFDFELSPAQVAALTETMRSMYSVIG